ncbi:hypothetical protein ElyMa_004873400 [Elysia marginata]|uniref:Uncharacterized protein n=1 Tax=Elysia marginata TaxID=1093978 RepID=A0AAV4ISX0_9GAST|nr:hypothetical protein ElyMa_004873400 [Elysia marginata]
MNGACHSQFETCTPSHVSFEDPNSPQATLILVTRVTALPMRKKAERTVLIILKKEEDKGEENDDDDGDDDDDDGDDDVFDNDTDGGGGSYGKRVKGDNESYNYDPVGATSAAVAVVNNDYNDEYRNFPCCFLY